MPVSNTSNMVKIRYLQISCFHFKVIQMKKLTQNNRWPTLRDCSICYIVPEVPTEGMHSNRGLCSHPRGQIMGKKGGRVIKYSKHIKGGEFMLWGHFPQSQHVEYNIHYVKNVMIE